MLEYLNIPYTGSDPLTLATCLDKGRTKEILSYHKISNPGFIVLNNIADVNKFNLEFPVILKPIGEGSSKGVFDSSFINNLEELKELFKEFSKKYNQPIIAEEYLPGKEFTAAMLGNDDETKVLPLIELNFSDLPNNLAPIYSYEAKWVFDSKENPLDIYTCPPDISPELYNSIEKLALDAYKILNCKDWSRIDIRLDNDDQPNIIEINPLPGILPDPTDNSCYPKAARTVGYDYNQIINEVLNAAIKRYNLQ